MELIAVAGDDALRVEVDGRIVQPPAKEMSQQLEEILGPTQYAQSLLLSLERSDFIDSSGVAWLLVCHKRFREAGGRLIVHSIPPRVLEVLKVLSMDRVFALAENESEALALLQRGQDESK